MPTPAKPTGTPVPPDERTCSLLDIAAFKPGVWDGVPVSGEALRQMADNFRKFSTGPNPYYTPFVSLKHNDYLSCGKVSALRMADGDLMRLDAVDVPEMVGAWRNAGKLHSPSIEFWEPKRDASGKLVGTFMQPDGTYAATPVLKCVTLLGGDAPAVKGLGPLPVATFACHGATRKYAHSLPSRRFSMFDRTAAIAALKAAGVDVSKITDATPDEVIQSFLEFVQKGNANPIPVEPEPNPNPAALPTGAAPFADSSAGQTLTVPNMGGGAPAGAGGGLTGQPSSFTVKFNDKGAITGIRPNFATPTTPHVDPAIQRAIDAQAGQLNALAARQAAIDRNQSEQLTRIKADVIRAFCDRMTSRDVAKMTPAQIAPMTAVFMKCDHVSVRKFADGKATGSELDEALATYEATAPKVRDFNQKVNSNTAGVTGPAGTDSAGLTPERRAAILGGSTVGRGVLTAQAAAARK